MGKKIKTFIIMFIFAAVVFATGFGILHFMGKHKFGLDSDNPTSIVLWHYYNGQQKIIFDELINEFNETRGTELGIVVDTYSYGSISDLNTSIIDSVSGKPISEVTPDMFFTYSDGAIVIDDIKNLASLDEYLDQSDIDEYIPDYFDDCYINGSLKLFPVAKSTELFILNKTDWNAFRNAVNADENSLQTWEGLAETAKLYYEYTDSLTPEENDGKAFFGRDAFANYMLVGAAQLGNEILSVLPDGKVSINVDEDTMRILWDNFYVPYISGYYFESGRFRTDNAKTGELISMVCSTTGASYFPTMVTKNEDESYPIEMEVLPPPNFEGFSPYVVKQGGNIAVIGSDKLHEYACVEFIKWFTDVRPNILFSVSSGYLPVKKVANDLNIIMENIKNSSVDIPQRNLDVLNVSLQVVKNSRLYSTKAFRGANDARRVTESALIDKAIKDREAVLKELNTGKELSDAVKSYNTDENFRLWLDEFKQSLNNAVAEE